MPKKPSPLFVAYVANEFVEQSDTLPGLLALLAEVQEPPPCPEDVAVWQAGKLVVVRHADGSLSWPRPERPRPRPSAEVCPACRRVGFACRCRWQTGPAA